MLYRRPSRSVSSNSQNLPVTAQITLVALSLVTVACLAQEPTTPTPQSGQEQAAPNSTITVPTGTRIALVLTYPVQSRSVHRGDDIYAQITAPVTSGNDVAIPPGTFVQGKVDKLELFGGRGELHLQSMAITFPDGYVAPVSGPVIMKSYEGYTLKDPGNGRAVAAITLPVAGAGLGAVIGHSVASSQPGTLTSSLPPGCSGPPPGCRSSSLSVPANKGPSTVIGAAVGGAIGVVASIVILTHSHHFFMDVGVPVEMVLQQPLSLPQDQVAAALQESSQHPMPPRPVASRPTLPPPLPTSNNHGTCYTPETPGTPPTVILGTPGPGGVPGPPTIIPGRPPIPGTPYPCP